MTVIYGTLAKAKLALLLEQVPQGSVNVTDQDGKTPLNLDLSRGYQQLLP